MEKGFIKLISYRRIFRKTNLVAGVFTFLPGLIMAIIGIPVYIAQQALFPTLNITLNIITFVIYIPLLGFWIRKVVANRLTLEVEDNIFFTGLKVIIYSILPYISFFLLVLVLIFMQSFVVRTLMDLSMRTNITALRFISLGLDIVIAIIYWLVAIAAFFLPRGVAVNYLYKK